MSCSCKVLKPVLGTWEKPTEPSRRRHCHPVAAAVRALALALGKKRPCAGPRERWVCSGHCPLGAVFPHRGGRACGLEWSQLPSRSLIHMNQTFYAGHTAVPVDFSEANQRLVC